MTTARQQSLKGAGFLLGFALGGFFDGILLHQVLQWHHLLSNVNAVRDMRMQILADGLFHALMYVVAAAGLVKLWRTRAAMTNADAGRHLWGTAWIGFGLWHVVDAVFSHWVTGIHRIKDDSPTPLVWDLIWFVAFGVLPLVIGWVVLRRPPGHRGGGGRGAAATLAVCAMVAGPIAALPAATDPRQMVVLFWPGIGGHTAFNAVGAVDAKVVWVDRSGGMWAIELDDPLRVWQLYRRGAVLVSNSGFSLGCISWMQAVSL